MLQIEYTRTFIKAEKDSLSPDAGSADHGRGMQPFKQQPPDTRPPQPDRLRPDHLFTLFTAEIIKQNIIFTR